MKKVLVGLLLALSLALPASGQFVRDSIGASSAACATTSSCVTLALAANSASATITVEGTWTATLQFEASVPGSTTFTNLGSTASNGITRVNVAAFSVFRVRASAYTSGVATVSILASTAALTSGGVTDPLTTNGFQVQKVIPNPTTALTAVASGSGAQTGDRYFWVTFVDAKGNETGYGPISTVVSFVNALNINMSNVPVSPSSLVVGRNIYQSATSDPNASTRVTAGTTIADNTTTTFVWAITGDVGNPRNQSENDTASVYQDSVPLYFSGLYTTVFGYDALRGPHKNLASTGTFNTAFGSQACQLAGLTFSNTCIGSAAGTLISHVDAIDNVLVGSVAGQTLGVAGTVVVGNTAVGSHALRGNGGLASSGNTAIGYYSMNEYTGTSTGGNTAVGYQSLRALTTAGDHNTAVGENAGYPSTAANRVTTADNFIGLGQNVGMNGAQFDNCFVAGNGTLCPAANAAQFGTTAAPLNFYFTGNVARFKDIATVGNGLPAQYATVDLTAQGAAIAATTLYAVPAAGAGVYRVCWVATVTRAATTSSTLGGSAGFQLLYTDNDDSVVKTTPAAGAPSAGVNQAYSQTNQGNTTASGASGCLTVNAKASTNIQYQFGYTSSGATTMQYNLHVRLEAL